MIIMNSSLELAYQLRRLSIDSCSSSVLPPPPKTLPSASTATTSYSAASSQEFELDCSGFDGMLSPTHSYASSYNSLSSAQGGLSRSRCIHNLSSLGSASYVESNRLTRQISTHASGPTEGWGYFVDTPAR